MNITVSGTLPFGHIDAAGVVHRTFVMRPVTIGDMEALFDSYPELMASGNSITRQRCLFARQLERLGQLEKNAITPELLAGLPLQDYAALDEASEELTKKLVAVCTPSGI